MKLQFDANQQFQLDAIAAMTSLFDGQPQGAPEYAVINVGEYGEMFSGQERTELGAGNRLLLAEEKLLANTRAVQIRNDIEVTQPDAPLEAWELFDAAAEAIHAALRGQRLIDADGRIQPAFKPQRPDFKLELPEAHADIAAAVVDLLAGYQIERHIRKERDERKNPLKKEVILSPEFQALWERIKPRTTYRVEFETDTLVRHAVEAIGRMAKVEAPRIRVSAGQVRVGKAGVGATAVSVAEERPVYGSLALPDILAYLQNETELTRSTLARILKESARLSEFFENPQRFLDQVVAILKNELHRLLVDGIKYERLPIGGPNTEWEMMLFKSEELVNYLNVLQVNKSVYDYVVYESKIEQDFARKLDQREDIKLFVKLPGWFLVDTPVGKYNPDWAILKHDSQALYLVRETKSTKDFMKLRTTEADKVRCGQRHFEALGVPFAVAVTAEEV